MGVTTRSSPLASPIDDSGMNIGVHPEAAKRAEQLAIHALDGMTSDPSPRPQLDSRYTPDLLISESLGPEDIAGPILGSRTDRFGREIERSYADRSHYFAITGLAHNDFQKAVRTLHQQHDVRAVASEKTIAQLVFEWMWRTRIDGPTSGLTDFVLSQLASLISEIEVVIPLFGIHVQSPLKIGNVTISDVTEDQLASWRAMSYRTAPHHRDAVDAMHDKLRRQLRGHGAARMSVVAERDFAVQRATEQAELSVAILRIASVGAFAPEKHTSFALLGREVVTRGMHIVIGPNDAFAPSEFIANAEDQRPWVLDNNMVQEVVLPIVEHWSALLAKEKRTPLEESALKSALLYSRATRYRNISEKLLHIFAAIESLLLRSESEPISATVGDRLAFAVGQNTAERMTIVRTFRDVYAIRSRFVHHALEAAPNTDTLQLLERFLVVVSQFFTNLGRAMSALKTKEDLIDALERRKYT